MSETIAEFDPKGRGNGIACRTCGAQADKGCAPLTESDDEELDVARVHQARLRDKQYADAIDAASSVWRIDVKTYVDTVEELAAAVRTSRGGVELWSTRDLPPDVEPVVLTRDIHLVANGYRVSVVPRQNPVRDRLTVAAAALGDPYVRADADPTAAAFERPVGAGERMIVIDHASGPVEASPLGIFEQREHTTLGDPPPEERGVDHGRWMSARSFEDEFSVGDTYGTRQEAINAYVDEHGAADGETFQTARLVYKCEVPSFPYDANRIVEEVGENMYGDWWDSAIENFVDSATGPHGAELEAALEKAWSDWCKKHNLELHGYTAEEEEHHIVGEDEDEETLAARKRDEDGARAEPAP